VWVKLFGAGEAGIRSLSAVVGVATIPVIYLCGRELVSRWAGVVAAALGAVSPFLIWYSQEARSYMLFGLLCVVALLFCARATRTGSGRDVAGWGAASTLAVFTHFFAGFFVAPTGLWLLWRLRSRGALAWRAVAAAAQVTVLPLAVGDTSHPLNWITQFPLSTRLQQIPTEFAASKLYKSPG
jgi:mannosyltransferase